MTTITLESLSKTARDQVLQTLQGPVLVTKGNRQGQEVGRVAGKVQGRIDHGGAT